MHGNPIGSAEMRFNGSPYRVRLVGAPRLTQGRDVVDIDTQVNHER